MKRLTLLKFRLPILRGARTRTVLKAAKLFDLKKKWEETNAFKKIEKFNYKSSLTDIERFKVRLLRQQRKSPKNYKYLI